MRIDYNEPRKSYSSPQTAQVRTRNDSSGSIITVVIIVSLISGGIGFGSGWMLSLKYAKAGFRAAQAQKSLENSPEQKPAPKPQVITPQPTDTPQQTVPSGSQQTASTPPATPATSDQPLGFYKNLPNGQKNAVLGSGINARDEKPAKQPLQAPIPTNVTKPPQPQVTDEITKPATPQIPEKSAVRKETNTYTVQVESLSLKSQAETLKTKLAGKGLDAYITESNQGTKGIWYRVRVGRGLEQEAAKELAAKLGKKALAIQEKD